MTKFDSRLRQQCSNMTACSTVQTEFCRYTPGRLPMHHQRMWASSLAVIPQTLSLPPALGLKRERTEGRKREKFYIYSDVTHTHTPGQSRVNPERQEEEKSGHTTGRRPKTAQGGEGNRRTSGTNLHGETDLTKTAHTPKPHDTLRRGTRGN